LGKWRANYQFLVFIKVAIAWKLPEAKKKKVQAKNDKNELK
jgi:hypothetical protein